MLSFSIQQFDLINELFQVESVRRCQKELVSQLMALVQSGCKSSTSNEVANATAVQPNNEKTSKNDHSILSQCGSV